MRICYYICSIKMTIMTTNVNVIRIGNSLGVILPSKVLNELGADEKAVLTLTAEDGKVTLSPVVTRKKDPFAAISKGGFYDSDIDPYEFSDMLVKTRGEAKPIKDILP